MSMPHPNTDPFAPVTRVELHAELADIRETLARIGERLEHVATKEYVGERLEHVATKEYVGERLEALATKEYVGQRLEHLATKEYVLRGLLGTIGLIAALLSAAVGIILRFG